MKVFRVGVIFSAFLLLIGIYVEAKNKPLNVVLIICDDLNRLGSGVDEEKYISDIKTPNIDKFAKHSSVFTRAYANIALCSPSRASLFTGVSPVHSQFLSNAVWWKNPILSEAGTIMDVFRASGYRVIGTGKIMHHFRPREWDEYGFQEDYGPMPWDGKSRVAHKSIPKPFCDEGPIGGSFGPIHRSENSKLEYEWVCRSSGVNQPFIYESNKERDKTPDEKNALWAKNKLKELGGKKKEPFFMAVGFVRPHTPLHVPSHWFDLYDSDSLSLPTFLDEDSADTFLAKQFDYIPKGFYRYRQLISSYNNKDEALRAWIHAYLASVSAVDECVGVVIDALKSEGLWDDTIIIVTSDHGYQLGQKDFLFKNALWEESMRIPLLIRVPNLSKENMYIDSPVSLIDIFPTLVDICELKYDQKVNIIRAGSSLKDLIDPSVRDELNRKAIGVVNSDKLDNSEEFIERQHWTIRTDRWRYIRYSNGSEELYDHDKDPNEWNNLALLQNYKAPLNMISEELNKALQK